MGDAVSVTPFYSAPHQHRPLTGSAWTCCCGTPGALRCPAWGCGVATMSRVISMCSASASGDALAACSAAACRPALLGRKPSLAVYDELRVTACGGWCSVARGHQALKVYPVLVVRAAARARQAAQPLQAGCANPLLFRVQHSTHVLHATPWHNKRGPHCCAACMSLVHAPVAPLPAPNALALSANFPVQLHRRATFSIPCKGAHVECAHVECDALVLCRAASSGSVHAPAALISASNVHRFLVQKLAVLIAWT